MFWHRGFYYYVFVPIIKRQMKVKNFLLFCSPGGKERIKEIERYGPELAPKPRKRDPRFHHPPLQHERPPLISSKEAHRTRPSRSRNSSGSASGGSSSSSSSFGKSTFFDLDERNRRTKLSETSESPVPSSASSDEQSVLENLDNYDLSSLAKALGDYYSLYDYKFSLSWWWSFWVKTNYTFPELLAGLRTHGPEVYKFFFLMCGKCLTFGRLGRVG